MSEVKRAEYPPLYEVELEAHPLWLLIKCKSDGEVFREEQIRWDELEKARRKAIEDLVFYSEVRNERPKNTR